MPRALFAAIAASLRPVVLALAVILALGQVLPAHARAPLPDMAELAEKAGPAVVNVNTTKSVKTQDQIRESFKGTPRSGPDGLRDQLERQPGQNNRAPRNQNSMGSGFIISKDGVIVTNNHVIEGADEIKVQLPGKGKPIAATVLGRDPELDLAVIKIETESALPFLEFGDSGALRVGSWVMAIGNPFGLHNTVTAGIVSAKGRVIGAGPFDDFIQTDASINPGNSGGPLLDLDGKVVGINTAIISTGQGIGFAIPSNLAKTVVADLREQKQTKRGWLGVSIQDMDENTAKALGLEDAKGALISSVMDGDPAAKAGVEVGDVVQAVNGEQVKNASGLLRAIAGIKPGGKAELQVWRRGAALTLTAMLSQRDHAKLSKAQTGAQQAEPARTELGMVLKPVNPEEAKALNLPDAGLLVTQVEADSPAEEAGMRSGDVILQAGQKPVNSAAAFDSIVDENRAKGVIMLLVSRDKRTLFRTIAVPEKR